MKHGPTQRVLGGFNDQVDRLPEPITQNVIIKKKMLNLEVITTVLSQGHIRNKK